MKKITREEFTKQYGEEMLQSFAQPPKVEEPIIGSPIEAGKELISGIGKSITEREEKVGEEIFRASEKGGKEILPVRAGLRVGGQVAGAVGDIAFEGLKFLAPKFVETIAKKGVEKVGTTQIAQSAFQEYQKFKTKYPEAMKDVEAVFNIASLIPIGKGAQLTGKGIARGAEKTAEVGLRGVKTGIDTTKRATAKIIKVVEPKPPTPIKAVGQVLQGKTSEVAIGARGLATLDTTGVKTYSELNSRISNKIVELAKKVDEDLGVDQTKRALKDLTVTGKTTSGKVVKIKPVDDALSQLEELYTKTGDKLSAANIKELALKAKNEGLTDLEVNDIARVYGSEFKDKAFSKLGEPLTSVNAQMYENTRTSLKEIARRGIKGAEAKTADKQMSALYKLQTLTKKNVEAVNKLQQRIQERGLLEKVGHAVSKYADVLTGGSIRGFVGGLLPRGAGYKVLNALDLEKALEKNLQIIQQAIKSESDDEIIKIIKSLELNQTK